VGRGPEFLTLLNPLLLSQFLKTWSSSKELGQLPSGVPPPFLSKVLEKVVVQQLVSHIDKHSLSLSSLSIWIQTPPLY